MYKSEKKRKKWDQKSMEQAVAAVKEKKMGFLKASKTFNVPRSTLENYVNSKQKNVDELINTRLGRKCVLGDDAEKELVQYCKMMEERFYGVTVRDVKQLAFQLAIKNDISHPFAVSKGAAGKKWLRNFLRRNPSLSLRKPQSMALARAKGFSKASVNLFYDLLEPELKRVGMKPNKVYNVDETGITVVQSRRSKILAVKGKKQIGTLSAQERGALMTVVTCMSPAGIFVPPLIVFPRKNMKPELLNGCPPGTIAKCHKSGWIQAHIFTNWLQHFIDYVKPTPQDPVLLILDGHGTHVRNLDVITLAREHGVTIVCLPPHTSHKLQPLDVSFMSPFKLYYSQEVETWLSNNPYRALSCYQIGELMGKAYAKCATLQIAVSGFKKCGIFPFDRNRFCDADFIDVEATLPGPSVNTPSENEPLIEPPEPVASTSKAPEEGNSSRQNISPFALRPLPKLPKKSSMTQRGRPAGKASVVTSSPYKSNLEKEIEGALNKENKIQKERKEKAQQLIKKQKVIAKELKEKNPPNKEKGCVVEGSRDTASCSKQMFLKQAKSKRKAKYELLDDTSEEHSDVSFVSTDNEDSADEECIYCSQAYKLDKCGEEWIRCIRCLRWAHELCSGTGKTGWKEFTCDFCDLT